jgi:hypothetical protein
MTMTIWERTQTALAGLGWQTAANTLVVATGSDLPDQFMVYQLISSPPEQHADNRETMRSYRMQVSIYSRNGLVSLPDVNGAMTAAGFCRGPIIELPYNQSTRHYGLALEFVYTESEE